MKYIQQRIDSLFPALAITVFKFVLIIVVLLTLHFTMIVSDEKSIQIERLQNENVELTTELDSLRIALLIIRYGGTSNEQNR